MTTKHQLPQLPYALEALEPVISREIMDVHYNKHHQGYVTNLNKALEDYDQAVAKNDLGAMITLEKAINFNGGGHINHSIFWTNLAPVGKGGSPEGALAKAIEQQWGSLEQFITKFNTVTGAIQGSGWGWLGYCKEKKRLEIATCANQDPLVKTGLIPLLGVDVWEHAYYLQYKNARPDYLKAIWQIINWKNVAERFQAAAG